MADNDVDMMYDEIPALIKQVKANMTDLSVLKYGSDETSSYSEYGVFESDEVGGSL